MTVQLPENLRYTEEHEWYDPESGWMGITDFAQQELGDIVFVELPASGETVEAGSPFMVVESVKSVSDVYAPVDGEVTDVNDNLETAPENVNQSPYEEGRMVQIDSDSGADNLMTAEQYREFVE
ncbi:MAG: glycine cleavage system protein GcvH [bacterium]